MGGEKGGELWRSPAQMPRWAARLELNVTSVRVERLLDVTEEDAAAEGAERLRWVGDPSMGMDALESHVQYFLRQWDARYGGALESRHNPWVWRVEFGVGDNGRQ